MSECASVCARECVLLDPQSEPNPSLVIWMPFIP